VYLIKEHDIPAALFVNADQTQLVYAPGDKMTWVQEGAKQIRVVGLEEKRALTVMVGASCDGEAVPPQSIYTSKSARSLASKTAKGYQEATDAGLTFVSSMSTTYWSNQHTMKLYVNENLVPSLKNVKQG
jgi:hypothetical protein